MGRVYLLLGLSPEPVPPVDLLAEDEEHEAAASSLQLGGDPGGPREGVEEPGQLEREEDAPLTAVREEALQRVRQLVHLQVEVDELREVELHLGGGQVVESGAEVGLDVSALAVVEVAQRY